MAVRVAAPTRATRRSAAGLTAPTREDAPASTSSAADESRVRDGDRGYDGDTTTVAAVTHDTGRGRRVDITPLMYGKSLMVVDDVASCRKISGSQLGRLGYNIMEAGQGEEAVKLYGENHAGIQGILMDLMMPVMDGYSAVNEIRAMEQKQAWKRMPIIAVTSIPEEEIKARSEGESFDGYVDKPTSLSKLAQVLEMMHISPTMCVEDIRRRVVTGDVAGQAADGVGGGAPHGVKRHQTPSTSTDTDSGDAAHAGSNEGSDDQNGRKGSNSDRDPDARSSGDSGNEKASEYYGAARAGPDNRSKRPTTTTTTTTTTTNGEGAAVTAGGTIGVDGSNKATPMTTTGSGGGADGKRTSADGSNDNSNDGSSDASRQGEEKSTMDKRDVTPQDGVGGGKSGTDGKLEAPTATALKSPARAGQGGGATMNTTSNLPSIKVEKTSGVTKTTDKAHDDKPSGEGSHLPCARCGSEQTRFCYYNNGVLSQPRHYCRSCQRYWTEGGTLRNLPKGSGRRKDRPMREGDDDDDDDEYGLVDVDRGPTADAVGAPPVPGANAQSASANAQSGMQRAILTLMTQVVGFDVDHAANNAGLVASRAGEDVASIVLNALGHSSEAVEIAVTLAKTTGWRIGISISAVASAAVAQGLTQREISSLISTQLPFLASALVREVSEQVKTMKLTRRSRGSNDSNDSGSGGSGGSGGATGGNSVSTATRVGDGVAPGSTLASVQATQHQLMQQWMSELQGMGFNAAAVATPSGAHGVMGKTTMPASAAPSTSGTQSGSGARPQASGASAASAQGWMPAVNRATMASSAFVPTAARLNPFGHLAPATPASAFGLHAQHPAAAYAHANPHGWFATMAGRFPPVGGIPTAAFTTAAPTTTAAMATTTAATADVAPEEILATMGANNRRRGGE